jgi:hypothetical protein
MAGYVERHYLLHTSSFLLRESNLWNVDLDLRTSYYSSPVCCCISLISQSCLDSTVSSFNRQPSHPHEAESKYCSDCCCQNPPECCVSIHEAQHPFLGCFHPRHWFLLIGANLRAKDQTTSAAFSRVAFPVLPPSLHQQPIDLLAMIS